MILVPIDEDGAEAKPDQPQEEKPEAPQDVMTPQVAKDYPQSEQKALSEILSSRLSRTSAKSSVSRRSLARRKILPRSIFETASQAGSHQCDESKREEQSLRQMTQNAMQRQAQAIRSPHQDMKDSSAYTLFISRKNSQDPNASAKTA